jgi:hypothetical protein
VEIVESMPCPGATGGMSELLELRSVVAASDAVVVLVDSVKPKAVLFDWVVVVGESPSRDVVAPLLVDVVVAGWVVVLVGSENSACVLFVVTDDVAAMVELVGGWVDLVVVKEELAWSLLDPSAVVVTVVVPRPDEVDDVVWVVVVVVVGAVVVVEEPEEDEIVVVVEVIVEVLPCTVEVAAWFSEVVTVVGEVLVKDEVVDWFSNASTVTSWVPFCKVELKLVDELATDVVTDDVLVVAVWLGSPSGGRTLEEEVVLPVCVVPIEGRMK